MGEADDDQGGGQHNLIPGLPQDIAMDCLVRVPYRFHSKLKRVCQRWRNLLTHPSFYRERQKVGTAEHLVCLVQALTHPHPHSEEEEEEGKGQHHHHHHPPLYGLSIYNASKDTWQRTMPGGTHGKSGIPMFCHCVALPSSGKLLLLGGWDPTTLQSVPDVYIFDFIGGSQREWHRAAPMSVARSFFACAAVGPSSVYVAGGHDNHKNALRSAEVYDADADRWTTLPTMEEERDECLGLSCDGDSRFWVVSGYRTESQGRFHSDADCYDPALASWTKVQGVWPFPNTIPRTTSISGGLWWFVGCGERQRGAVSKYNCKEKRWKVVASIPDTIDTSGVVGPGDRIFVMGSGQGAGAFILESEGGNSKWTHLRTPADFSGFVYSASSLLI